MKFNSIRFKISVLYIVILGAILIIYSSFLYFSLHYTLYNEMDDELKSKAVGIDNTIRSYLKAVGPDEASFKFAVKRTINLDGEHPNQNKIKRLEREWLQKVDKFDLKEDYINFLNLEGRPIVSSNNISPSLLPLFLKEAKVKKGEEAAFKNIKLERRNFRMISLPFYYEGKKQYIIQIATSLKPLINMLYTRLFHIAVSIPLILLFASFIGRLFAARILKPVMEIAQTANKITHEDLGTRIQPKDVDEEMKFLVNAFNDMISRLEKSFGYIAEFSSHVAHELKTPLAIIKGESELALKKERDLEEYKRVLKINLEETERMAKTIEDLLLLAKLDYRPDIFKFEQFNLIEFFEDIYQHAKTLAFSKKIIIDINMPKEQIFINADRLHLRRLFFNLINNAIRFTREEGRIDIIVKCENKKAIVSISDTGIGIAEEDLRRIFDRFFHKDITTQDAPLGNGLGLSIAQSIAKIHNGDIAVQSRLGEGSTFTVTLLL